MRFKQLNLKKISKDVCSSGAIYAFCLQITMQDTQGGIQPSMQGVLHEFSDVFMEPSSLPPSRQIDHNIPSHHRSSWLKRRMVTGAFAQTIVHSTLP